MGINRTMTTFQRIKTVLDDNGCVVPLKVIAEVMNICMTAAEHIHVPETLIRQSDGSYRPVQPDMFDDYDE